jgi:hypothetical protein
MKWDSILVLASLTLDVKLAVSAVGHITKQEDDRTKYLIDTQRESNRH